MSGGGLRIDAHRFRCVNIFPLNMRIGVQEGTRLYCEQFRTVPHSRVGTIALQASGGSEMEYATIERPTKDARDPLTPVSRPLRARISEASKRQHRAIRIVTPGALVVIVEKRNPSGLAANNQGQSGMK
jgi:hypothetical protein